MPEPLTSYIIDFHYACYDYASLLQSLYNYTLYLGSALASEAGPASASAANNMAAVIWDMRAKFSIGTDSVRYPLVVGLQWIDTNWPSGGGSCTMDDIINAMLTATDSQYTSFIGIVDAYRVALWNAPFNADFYAALARGFTKWRV